MSASFTLLSRCCQRSALLLVAKRRWSSSTASPAPSLYRRLLLYLTQRFYDVEMLMGFRTLYSTKKLKRRNAYYGYAQQHYGQDIASAYFVLSLNGGFRYAGHSEWYRADKRGKFNWSFLDHRDTPLEEVDMSHTVINYAGLGNLAEQQSLRALKLQGCPEVDDWFLARLHLFQDTLEELDLSHCPRITTGGLAALKNLRKLKRLDVSSLPRISSPGLVVILLEEMLPECHITATGYNFRQGLLEGAEKEEEQVEELLQRQK